MPKDKMRKRNTLTQQPVIQDIPIISTPRIAKFYKVSYQSFLNSFLPTWEVGEKIRRGMKVSDKLEYTQEDYESVAKAIYNAIELPHRHTKESAGYDFIFPYGYTVIAPGDSIIIPTGIKCQIATGWCMMIHPRSSLGLNYRLQLDDTISVIDADYYNNPSNEGNIIIKITNDSRISDNNLALDIGQHFCQGVFIPYGLTIDDNIQQVRVGGVGSTNHQ